MSLTAYRDTVRGREFAYKESNVVGSLLDANHAAGEVGIVVAASESAITKLKDRQMLSQTLSLHWQDILDTVLGAEVEVINLDRSWIGDLGAPMRQATCIKSS